LLRIICGQVLPDQGEVRINPGIRISMLQQGFPTAENLTVTEYVKEGLKELNGLIEEFQKLSHHAVGDPDVKRLAYLQHEIEVRGGWQIDTQVSTVLSELDLPANKRLTDLSGGWQRRAVLAQALVNRPDLLLLDEPTNHLDFSTIEWLERKIQLYAGSVLFITHDRAFLQKLATRVLELDRGILTSWTGTYRKYLEGKMARLEEERRNNALFDKRLEQEEAWIRQGVKARRTRNEGRVRALYAMRETLEQRIKPLDKVRIVVQTAELSGRKVIDAHNVSYGYADETLIHGFTLKIRRGDRIGLVGNNGVGKTTLLKLLLGELTPAKGTIKFGTNLVTGFFDQHRRELDGDKTVADIIGDGSDYIRINGREQHVIGYLKGFLFSPRRAMSPVKVLSGGECNRLILARLLSRESNLLVLDEPTNDLDLETLQVLEARLREYEGTLIVVSHDREFLDNVVTSTLVFEADGVIRKYPGGYTDWLRQGKQLEERDNPAAKTEGTPGLDSARSKRPSTKLSYKLKLELDALPQRIEMLEAEIRDLHAQTLTTEFYSRPYNEVQEVLESIRVREALLDEAMRRWDELEGMQKQLQAGN
jgi:ATP-binding cassette subfamily F protein uup